MNYICLKTGYESLDSIHGIGLGLLLWGASGQPVTVEDCGLFHVITIETPIHSINLPIILEGLLPLTTAADVEADTQCTARATYVLDGALAWLFTSPGVRAVSVASIRRRSRHNPKFAEVVISKWSRLRDRVLSLAQRVNTRLGTSADRILAEYAADAPQHIVFGPKPSCGMSIPLILEPALGYAYRHVFADGDVSDKINVAAISPTLAPILLLLGSIYCIRGQDVAGGLVHIYTPIVQRIAVDGSPLLPCLVYTDHPSDEAVLYHWFELQHYTSTSSMQWARLCFQILQTQSVQQSFSLKRGALRVSPANSPELTALYRRWTAWLKLSRRERPLGFDDLVHALLHRDAHLFFSHLRAMALALRQSRRSNWLVYSASEICEVIALMKSGDPISSGLVEILNRPVGTYRFGTALRSLGEFAPAVQRDYITDLDSVRDQDQLLRVLARIAEQGAITAAKNPFAIVPNDDDLRGLLIDIETYGAHSIAGLIIILATLRYARRPDEEPSPGTDLETITEVA
jgi:hypothetical protein